jgi:hypothetical protein
MPIHASHLSRLIPIALLLVAPAAAQARNLLQADGPGGTYELIRTAYTTELPDCGHMVDHITEAFDDELKKNVFVFHAHEAQDDDRCGGTDRQRTEIRARAADIIANNGETVHYSWKFKLDSGFQGSPSFTHIFQIKSDLGAPIMTLTPRVSTFEITGRAAGSSGRTDLAKFRGVWVFVTLTVLYSDNGRIELNIRKLSDGTVLYSHTGGADMWDAGASAHDSKFGIYRSLNNRGMLRDEQVRFADFCASKTSAAECADQALPPPMGGGNTDAGGGARDGGAAPDAGGGTGGAGGGGGSGGSGGSGSGGSGGSSGGSGGSSAGSGGSSSGGSGGSGGSGTTGTGGSGGSGSTGSGGSGGSTRTDARPSTPSPEPTKSAASGGCRYDSGPNHEAPAWLVALVLVVAGGLGVRRRR